MTSVSVALCTFNGERFLNEQLASLLDQTRLPDELVVCDDRSNDNTVNLLRSFAERSPFPVYIHENESNLGFAKNFEKAISLCRGDLIFLCDQDDVWMPEKIDQISSVFGATTNTDLVFTDAELISVGGERLQNKLFDIPFNAPLKKALGSGSLLNLLLLQNHIPGATMAFRKKLFQYLVPFPESICELHHDGWIGLVASARETIEYLDRPLIKYRLHPGQLIGVRITETEENRQERVRRLLEYAEFCRERVLAVRSHFKTSEQLGSYLPAIENSARPILAGLNEKIDHLASRSMLPRSPFARWSKVTRQALAGNYHRYSNGFKSVIKDLINLSIIA